MTDGILPKLEWPKAELCKTCIHTRVCGRDKNLVGDMYVAPTPWFFDEEYKRKAWEDYKKREEEGFPCDEYLPEKGASHDTDR